MLLVEAALTVTEATPETEGIWLLVAVMVALPGPGTIAGAV